MKFQLKGKQLKALLVLSLLSWASGSAHAVVITNPFPPSPQCLTSEVSLGGTDADACAGYYPKPNGETAETNLLNDATDGDDWTYIFKTQSGGADEGPGVFQGIRFSVDTTFATSGGYTLFWEDVNGAVDLNLPISLDLAFSMKAGNVIAYYIFEQELLTDDPYSKSGSFTLEVTNALSHQSLFVRSPGNPGTPDNPVPEPGTLALLGLGLFSLRWARRRA